MSSAICLIAPGCDGIARLEGFGRGKQFALLVRLSRTTWHLVDRLFRRADHRRVLALRVPEQRVPG